MSLRSESGLKTADFSVQTPHGRIIAEIEELTPNDDDLRQIREMKETGTTIVGFTIGSRARKAIRRAANMAGLRIRCSIWNLIILMQQCTQTLSSTFHFRKVSRNARTEAGGRTTTKDQTNYLSAVGVIFDGDDKIFVYHNYHAEIEFPAETPTATTTGRGLIHMENHGNGTAKSQADPEGDGFFRKPFQASFLDHSKLVVTRRMRDVAGGLPFPLS